MAIAPIDLLNFKETSSEKFDNCSHEVKEVTSVSDNSFWICKKTFSEHRARYEVLAQEFYRLIINYQPKTILAKNKELNSFCILSEKINNFKPLPEYKQNRFYQGIYAGLGQVLITAIFLHEVDLNSYNIGIDSTNKVYKIDGDWTLAALSTPFLFKGITTEITEQLIENLPFVNNYFVYNWLDIVKKKKNYSASNIVDANLSSSPLFRAEINEAILKILLLPTGYMQYFIATYMSENLVNDILFAFKERQQELLNVVLSNDSFIDYLNRGLASSIKTSYLAQIKNFKANDCRLIVDEEKFSLLTSDYNSNFDNLQSKCERIVLSPANISAIDEAVNSNYNNNRMFKSPLTKCKIRLNNTCNNLADLASNN